MYPQIVAHVLHHNSVKTLINCLFAISNQTFSVNKIVVIDNGSYVDNLNEIKNINLEFELITLTNLGVGVGHNTGWKYILEKFNPDFIWVLEHDVIPDHDCLEKLVEGYNNSINNSHQVLAVHPLEDSGLAFNKYKYFVFSNYKLKRLLNNAKQESYYGGLSFNGLLLPTRTISAIGFLNEDYFIGFEDIDFYKRILNFGGKVLKVKGAIVKHNLYKNRKQIQIGNNIILLGSETILRSYYSTRNRLYMEYFNLDREPFVIFNFWLKFFKSCLLIILLKNQKIIRLLTKYKAYKDAINGDLGEKKYWFLIKKSML